MFILSHSGFALPVSVIKSGAKEDIWAENILLWNLMSTASIISSQNAPT